MSRSYTPLFPSASVACSGTAFSMSVVSWSEYKNTAHNEIFHGSYIYFRRPLRLSVSEKHVACRVFYHIVTTVTLDHIVTMPSDHTVK
jgi:hypothetical protein